MDKKFISNKRWDNFIDGLLKVSKKGNRAVRYQQNLISSHANCE